MKTGTLFRSLFRSKLNSSIIIISLAIGLACVNLISVFIIREVKTDGFHQNKNRIYALQADDPFGVDQKMYYILEGAAEYMKDNFAEVEDYCRIVNAGPPMVTVKNQDYFDQKMTIAASPNFFDFFSYPLVYGNAGKVLESENNVVISEELAHKYFGEANPLGEQIIFGKGEGQEEMVVSGVFKKPTDNTQMVFDMVRSVGNKSSRCYLLLATNTNTALLEEKFFQNKEVIPIVQVGTPGTHYLKSLHDAYFDATRRQTIEASRDKAELKIAFVIGLMILGVAVFNYLGLVNNRLSEKTGEHSIRRINGSSKMNLVFGFIVENSLLVAVGFIISLVLLIWMLPFFNALTGARIPLTAVFQPLYLMVFATIVGVILLATFLFIFARVGLKINVSALKSLKPAASGKAYIPAFNISQLVVSTILIAGSLIITKQINYISDKDIGLNKEVLEVRIPGQYKNLSPIFKSELEKNSSVELISLANASPVLEHMLILQIYDENGVEKQYSTALFVGDENYAKTLGIEIIDGKSFSENPEANKNKIIINESLASFFSDRNMIGDLLPGSESNRVIGICKDFHYGSLKRVIEPGYIGYNSEGFYLMVKPVPGQSAEARKAITEIWGEMIPDFPLNMESIGAHYEWMHRENRNYAKLIAACCLISVFLSMIGLFGVSYYTSRKRIKEIGVRKVNGAKVVEILSLLNTDFLKWVGISFIISTPVSWYFMNKWLSGFAYKTEMDWWIFALAGILSLGIALLTVSFQSWKAATKNPVEALRYE
ncbi:MAG: ABC transporter permease [Prolixibacteraceae bacterium]|nr:ABC transporter permease [Prolixibacteraceae bacterium]